MSKKSKNIFTSPTNYHLPILLFTLGYNSTKDHFSPRLLTNVSRPVSRCDLNETIQGIIINFVTNLILGLFDLPTPSFVHNKSFKGRKWFISGETINSKFI